MIVLNSNSLDSMLIMPYDKTVFNVFRDDILPPKLLFCRSKTFKGRSIGKILASIF